LYQKPKGYIKPNNALHNDNSALDFIKDQVSLDLYTLLDVVTIIHQIKEQQNIV
jgi:hypothetical protein